ncbi:MAG: 30S ribosomal protein S12 methylthiotransferase RimO, partial [Fibrobacteraceae bacterium]|nr:30S ribosomal protein S12 methylthiotransferase RimO [Fibrobacteraceae bacterium]
MPTKKNRIYTVHLGCSKNQVDAENLVGELLQYGFEPTDNRSKANYILVNTCGFIEAAKEESINAILAQVKVKKPTQKLIVSGCLSGRYGKELEKELPEVDYWVGTYRPGELAAKLGVKAPEGCNPDELSRLNLGGLKHHAYLKIAEGCNRKCAYCAIPLIRGNQKSRSIEDIVEEAKELEKQGVQELTLIAQDTTYFGREKGKKGGTLCELLKALLKETKIKWIRTLYWYPMFIDDELLELMAKEKRLCKYVDIPIQHASDKMLKAMKRHYRKEELRELLLKIRKKVPGVTIRSTVLVGYPGETQEDFDELMELLQEIKFDHLGGFVFSLEEGTPAEQCKLAPVDEGEARARLDAVTDYHEEFAAEKAEKMIGKKITMIIDEVAEGSEYHFYGRTEGDALDTDNIVKVIEGDGEVGTFRKALVVDAEPHEL